MPRRVHRSDVFDLANAVNRDHPLCPDHWWMCLPGAMGGGRWVDIGKATPAHGTLTNMTTSASGWRGTTRPGGFGHVLFDGTDDYLNIPAATSLDLTPPFTLSFWLKFTTTSNLVVWERNGNSGFSVQVISGKIQVNIGGTNTTQSVITTSTWNDGNWHQCCFTASSIGSHTGAAYVDGRDDTNSANNGAGTPSYAGAPMVIGSRLGSFGFAGPLDSLMLHPRPLSAAEVRALYDESRCGCPGLLRRVRSSLGGYAPVSYTETVRAQTILAVLGATDTAVRSEAGRGAILRAGLGETDVSAAVESRGQIILAQCAVADVAAFIEAAGLTLRAVLSATDAAALLGSGGATLRALLGETDTAVLLDTTGGSILRAILGETDTFHAARTFDHVLLLTRSGARGDAVGIVGRGDGVLFGNREREKINGGEG